MTCGDGDVQRVFRGLPRHGAALHETRGEGDDRFLGLEASDALEEGGTRASSFQVASRSLAHDELGNEELVLGRVEREPLTSDLLVAGDDQAGSSVKR